MSGREESPERITLDRGDYFRVIEERRRASEGVLWQLLSVTLAAQAFLLSAGLKSDAESSTQIAVGVLGIVAVVGAGLLVLYQATRATIFERWVSQTVRQPLRPDELAIESLNCSPRMIRLINLVFKTFYGVCVGGLLAFLIADGYVLGLGLGCW